MLRLLGLILDAYRNRRSLAALGQGTRRGTSRGGLGGALLGFVSALAGRRPARPGGFRSYLDFIARDAATPPELGRMLDTLDLPDDAPAPNTDAPEPPPS